MSLILLSLACVPRYLCGPGTHAEGDWCVSDEPKVSGSDTAEEDTGTADTGADDSGADTADSGGDTEPTPARLVLNELMSSNDTKATDEQGEYDDFIELYNAGGSVADLSAVSLTDESENLALFTFAAGTTLGPGEWLVVWADNQPEQGALHAPFTLQSAADTVWLVQDPTGAATVLDELSWTEMDTEVSSGRYPDGGEAWVTTASVTPGAANQP